MGGVDPFGCTYNGLPLSGDVYITDYEFNADLSVFLTDYEFNADLSVFLTDFQFSAGI